MSLLSDENSVAYVRYYKENQFQFDYLRYMSYLYNSGNEINNGK